MGRFFFRAQRVYYVLCLIKGVSKGAYKKYIGARFARVYPLYFITTLWAFACSIIIVHLSTHIDSFLAEIFNPKALPATLLLVQSMHVGYITAPLNTPSWSLSTEWWAYIIFPFLVPVFVRLKGWGKLAATLLLIGFFIVLRDVFGPISYGSTGPTINMLTDFGFLRCLAGFFTGMLCFTFYDHRAGYHIFKRDWFFALSFIGVLAAMHFGLLDIATVAFFPFILISAAYNQTMIKRILDTRVLQRLGDWSFSIYMVHMPIIFTFYAFAISKNHALLADLQKAFAQKPNYLANAAMCLVIVVLTLIFAALSYRFVEVPTRNYFNKVFNTKRRVVSQETVEV